MAGWYTWIVFASSISAFTQTTEVDLYKKDFSDGSGWTLSGLWKVDALPDPISPGVFAYSSAPSSLNWNNDSYELGGTGLATSPEIDLTGTTDPMLEFRCQDDCHFWGVPTTDPHRLLRITDATGTVVYKKIQFLPSGGAIDPALAADGYETQSCIPPTSPWQLHQIPLDPAWGKIKLVFEYTGSGCPELPPPHDGWFIDDLRVFHRPLNGGGGGTPDPEFGPTGPSGHGGDCYLATAAYGHASRPEVVRLKQFRRIHLKSNGLGAAASYAYEHAAPGPAWMIAQSETARSLVRSGLAALAWPLGLILVGGLLVHAAARRLRSTRNVRSARPRPA